MGKTKKHKDKGKDKKGKKEKEKDRKKKQHRRRQMPLFFAPQPAPPSSDSSSSASSNSVEESESADDERDLKKLHKGATEVKDLPKSRLQDVLEGIDNCFDTVLTAEIVESTLLQALFVLTRTRPMTKVSSFRCTGGCRIALASTQGLG